jgi:hypothetical protein
VPSFVGCNENARRPVSRVLSAPESAGRPFLLDAPRGAPHATNPDGRARMPLRLAAPPSLFGLAPGGVYHAAPVARCAVRSCRTVSPLPAGCLATLARAVCFLWHCPWGRPRRPLTGTVFPWSPDFPLPLTRQRPSSRLARQRCMTPPPASSTPQTRDKHASPAQRGRVGRGSVPPQKSWRYPCQPAGRSVALRGDLGVLREEPSCWSSLTRHRPSAHAPAPPTAVKASAAAPASQPPARTGARPGAPSRRPTPAR